MVSFLNFEESNPANFLHDLKPLLIIIDSQWAKSPKNSLYECIFDNMTLYFKCRINKTHSLCFLAICPLGQ